MTTVCFIKYIPLDRWSCPSSRKFQSEKNIYNHREGIVSYVSRGLLEQNQIRVCQSQCPFRFGWVQIHQSQSTSSLDNPAREISRDASQVLYINANLSCTVHHPVVHFFWYIIPLFFLRNQLLAKTSPENEKTLKKQIQIDTVYALKEDSPLIQDCYLNSLIFQPERKHVFISQGQGTQKELKKLMASEKRRIG